MNIKLENMGAFGIVLGAAGLLWGAYQTKKSNDIASKLGVTLAELEGKTHVELQDDVVNTAMINAVKKKANKIVDYISDQIRDDYHKEIKSLVKKEVDKDLDDVHDTVEEKIEELVNSIDEEKFIEEMKANAKKAMSAKFNSSLDGIASEFKDQYKNLGKFLEMAMGGFNSKPSNNNRMYFGFGD